jgi:starvation-inducible DNA-binding protein
MADTQILYMKIHNFHWNVKGMHFMEIHQKTEGYYNHFGEFFDDVAERVLQLEGKPFVTLKSILENARIKENSKTEFSAKEVLTEVKTDFVFLHSEIKKILNTVDEKDIPTTNLLQNQIEFLEKEIWILKSSI